MPVPMRSCRIFLWALATNIMLVILCLPQICQAATVVGTGEDGSYTGKVHTAVIKAWTPPPALKTDFTVRIRISIDGNGKITSCKPLVPSGLEAYDAAACGAAKKAGPFGTPPYGQPLDVYMTFWTGSPKNWDRREHLDSEAAARAEVMARTKADAAHGEYYASTTEDLARQRAEAAAKATGKELPAIHPKPVAPAAPNKIPPKASPTKAPAFATQNAQNGPATQPVRQNAHPSDTKKSAAAQPPGAKNTSVQQAATASSRPSSSAETSPPLPASTVRSPTDKYRRNAEIYLCNAIYIPKETPLGTYTARLRLQISPKGKIEHYKTLSSSGDVHLDRAIRSGIRRLERLPPPPQAIKGELDVTLTLTRR
ncbi:MAG: TonB family protein [Desulfovibrio sp.]|nr:TonB family protein [Desulfovibrio sp.]